MLLRGSLNLSQQIFHPNFCAGISYLQQGTSSPPWSSETSGSGNYLQFRWLAEELKVIPSTVMWNCGYRTVRGQSDCTLETLNI